MFFVIWLSCAGINVSLCHVSVRSLLPHLSLSFFYSILLNSEIADLDHWHAFAIIISHIHIIATYVEKLLPSIADSTCMHLKILSSDI